MHSIRCYLLSLAVLFVAVAINYAAAKSVHPLSAALPVHSAENENVDFKLSETMNKGRIHKRAFGFDNSEFFTGGRMGGRRNRLNNFEGGNNFGRELGFRSPSFSRSESPFVGFNDETPSRRFRNGDVAGSRFRDSNFNQETNTNNLFRHDQTSNTLINNRNVENAVVANNAQNVAQNQVINNIRKETNVNILNQNQETNNAFISPTFNRIKQNVNVRNQQNNNILAPTLNQQNLMVDAQSNNFVSNRNTNNFRSSLLSDEN